MMLYIKFYQPYQQIQNNPLMINKKRRPTTAYTTLKFYKHNNKDKNTSKIVNRLSNFSDKHHYTEQNYIQFENQEKVRPITSKVKRRHFHKAITQAQQATSLGVTCAHPDIQFARSITQNPQALTSTSFFFTNRQRCKTVKFQQQLQQNNESSIYVFQSSMYRKNRVNTMRSIADKINLKFDININPKRKISSQLHKHITEKSLEKQYKDDQNEDICLDGKVQEGLNFDQNLLQEIGSYSRSKNRVIKGFFHQKKNLREIMKKNTNKSKYSARQISQQKKKYHSYYNNYLQNFSQRKQILSTQFLNDKSPSKFMKQCDQVMQRSLKGKTLQLFFSLKNQK